MENDIYLKYKDFGFGYWYVFNNFNENVLKIKNDKKFFKYYRWAIFILI